MKIERRPLPPPVVPVEYVVTLSSQEAEALRIFILNGQTGPLAWNEPCYNHGQDVAHTLYEKLLSAAREVERGR